MAHRTCGVTYYATALPPFLSEKTEITLVRKELEQSLIVAVPTSAYVDPADSLSVVTWKGYSTSTSDDLSTAVRYGIMDGGQLRLHSARPASWTEWRHFECAIPFAALVANIPAALGRC